MLTPGDKAPDFTLPDIRGGRRCLADFLSALPLWLIVVKPSCSTCRMAAPLAERAHRAAHGAPDSVVLIVQGAADEAHDFADGLGLTMPVLAEEAPWPASRALGLSFVPTFFMIEPGGVVSMSAEGFLRSEWEAAARNLVRRAGALRGSAGGAAGSSGPAAGASAGGFSLALPGEDIPILRPG